MTPERSSLSILIPVYNEQESLAEVRRRVRAFIEAAGFTRAEVLLIDDGSRDNSAAIIRDIVRQDPLFKGVLLTRNFGHQAAVSTGLELASGDLVAIIDGDLQDPPEAIGLLLTAIDNGADVAFGVRKARKEGLLKRLAYFAFYRLLRSMSSIEIPLDSGDFCVMRRCVVRDMLRLPERNRFVRGLRAWVGYKQVGVEYERAARYAGTPQYTLRKLIGLAYDGLFSFSALPVKVMQTMGFGIAAMAFLVAMAYFIIALVADKPNLPAGWPTLIISIWFLGGVQLLFMGLVGEYVYRTFDETRRRPVSLVRQIISNPAASPFTPAAENEECRATTDASTPISIVVTGGGAREKASSFGPSAD